MLPRNLRYALAGCLLHAAFASARVGIKIPIPIVISASSVFAAVFAFLIIFSILTGLLFLVALPKACGTKEEIPPDVSPMKYDVGRVYPLLVFITVSLWWAQLIIYTVYVRSVFMKPRQSFPESAYLARFSLDQFADLFTSASLLWLIHYRRKIHATVVAPLSALKQTFDVGLLGVHLAVICYSTAFHSISIADMSDDSDTSYLNWLTSHYVYTAIYALMAVNVTVTLAHSKKALKENFIKDEPYRQAGIIAGSMIAHALFKIIMAALYSQFENPKIDYDVLRVFEVIVLGFTYFLAQMGLLMAESTSTEDDKKLKEIKRLEKEKQAEEEGHNHPLK